MNVIIYLFFLSIYLLITTPLVFLARVVTFPFDKNGDMLTYITACYCRGFFTIAPLWKTKIIGEENIRKGVPYVLCANHRALLDIPLLNSLNFKMKWVTKRDVYKVPLIGWVIRMRRDIAIDRGDASSAKAMFRRCKEELSKGVSINIFPEGTRSKDGRVNAFKEGAFMVAKQSKVAILPVVTSGTWEVTNLSKYLLGLKLKFTFGVNILPEISAEEVAATPTRVLMAKVHDIMLKEHMRISPEIYANSNKVINE